MNKIVKITAEVLKTDNGQLLTQNLKKLNRQLNLLEPGVYKITIEKASNRMSRLKKYYFVMESELGKHLGMRKTEIHNATKMVKDFMKLNETTSELEYDSVADIKNEEEMMARIYAFQIWSAKEFDYKHEPFKEEDEN